MKTKSIFINSNVKIKGKISKEKIQVLYKQMAINKAVESIKYASIIYNSIKIGRQSQCDLFSIHNAILM